MKYLAICLLLLAPLVAEEVDLGAQLREALYTEEVTRDSEAAARQYEDLLTRYGAQRAFAATALFRLAEVRRKQDRREESVALYQRLLREFPDREIESRLARENLAALGAKPKGTAPPADDEESAELRRLQGLAKSSPDILLDPKTLDSAVRRGWLRVVAFLLSQGADPRREGVLSDAARGGALEICRLLVEKGKPTPEEGAEALSGAVTKGRMAVLAFLLESGIPHNLQDGAYTPLHEAVQEDNLAAVKLLVEHGADIDAMRADRIGGKDWLKYVGTPLHLAAHTGRIEMCKLLLDAGAKPDLATPKFGLTPLHLAVASRGRNSGPIVSLLLAKGADPDRRAGSPELGDQQDENTVLFWKRSPLELVLSAAGNYGPLRKGDVAKGDVAKFELLLKGGADPNGLSRQGTPLCHLALGDRWLPVLRLLLEAGVDPDTRNSKGDPLLASRFALDSVEAVGMLLEAGADPNLAFGQIELDGGDDPFAEKPGEVVTTTNSLLLQVALERRDRLLVMKMLLEAGARPGPALGFLIDYAAPYDEDGSVVAKLLEFRPERFNLAEIPRLGRWKPAARRVFLEKAVYPALAARPEVGFLFQHSGRTEVLASKGDSDSPRPLAPLLFDHFETVINTSRNVVAGTGYWSNFAHVRSDGAGGWAEQALDLSGDEAFPDLQWGDIIVAVPDPDDPAFRDEKAAKQRYAWAFRKRISFPIAVDVDGAVREITVNGGLLVFDPTRDEVPWLEAARVASLLASGAAESWHDVTVQRDGWDEIRLTAEGKKLASLALQAGDRLVIKTRAGSDERHQVALLTTPGVPFSRGFGKSVVIERTRDGREVLAPAAAFPTLIQAIVDTYAPWARGRVPADIERFDAFLAAVAEWENGHHLMVPVIPSHPDFSRVRIRRLADDGSESVIEVDLAAAIARCADETPAANARAVDVPLQVGDIVELALHEDRFAQPWGGFSPAEVRFFRKALSGRIQFVKDGAEAKLVEMDWQPPQWRSSAAGLLPLPPPEGVSTMRASQVLEIRSSGEIELERDGERLGETSPSWVFLRDRDVFYWNTNRVSIPGVRRVPTPPSSSR